MKLNKSQRHTVYCIMLAEAEEPSIIEKGFIASELSTYKGYCFMFDCIFNTESLYHSFHYTLPELYKKKPNGCDKFWFSCDKEGWQKRIELLKQCIEETY